MAEPTINIYRDLIVPLGDSLRQDPRFAGVKNIVYDKDEISYNEMPCIEYYVDSPWTDETRGSGSFSPQTRRMTARIAFNIWCYDARSQASMDETMFELGGLLLDHIRERRYFSEAAGIAVSNTPALWEVARPETDQGFVGLHRLVFEFDIFAAN